MNDTVMPTYIGKETQLEHPYVTSGNRVYVVGSQDGLFPDVGDHVPGEMWGVWDHPIKLLDGFFIGIEDDSGTAWPTAREFRTYPFYTEHHYASDRWSFIRRQFVPDDEEALVVTLVFTNHANTSVRYGFTFVVKSDLRPGWLGTELEGSDEARMAANHVVITDSTNDWAVCIGTDAPDASIRLDEAGCPFETQGNGTYAALCVTRDVPAGATTTFRFYIAGSAHGVSSAEETLARVQASADALFEAKTARYCQLEKRTKLDLPDAVLQRAVQWVKYNTDWLVRTVPAIGNGLGAGFPEYPWWFSCDNGYALQGVLPLGMFELCQDTLRLLACVSQRENGNGRIIHEVSSTGVVFNPGNTQETPQFCKTVWDTFAWTGDMAFLEEMFPHVCQAITWIDAQFTDQAGLPVGNGIIEVDGLNFALIDTAVYTQQAWVAASNMAEVLGYQTMAREMKARADVLKQVILERFWLEEDGLFADVMAPASEMGDSLVQWATAADAAGNVEAASWYRRLAHESASEDGWRPYLLRHWVVNTPLEVGIAPKAHARRALERMRSGEFRGPHGLYLSGTERTHMMTISTSVQAVAECRYGCVDEAVSWMRQIAGTQDLVMPGSFSEMSPDYGCFVQAWTAYGLVYPIVCQMFGVQPLAHQHQCMVDVHMPTDWRDVSLERLRVGQNWISLRYQHHENEEPRLTIATEQAWTFCFALPVAFVEPTDGTARLDGRTLWLQSGAQVTLKLLQSR